MVIPCCPPYGMGRNKSLTRYECDYNPALLETIAALDGSNDIHKRPVHLIAGIVIHILNKAELLKPIEKETHS